jgi:cytochrome c
MIRLIERRSPSPRPPPTNGSGGDSLLPPAGEGGRRSRPDQGPRRPALIALAFCLAAGPAAAGGLAGDPARGEQLYEACTDCHSLDKNDVGPRHRGVFGRKAGSLPDYNYSEALRSSNIVWNEETLDKWLTDPQAFVPGAKMYFHLDNAQDRADVIAYLKERFK